jgi:hypothetical protein
MGNRYMRMYVYPHTDSGEYKRLGPFLVVRIQIIVLGDMTPCTIGEYQVLMKGKIFCCKTCRKMTDTQSVVCNYEVGTQWLQRTYSLE